MNEIKSFELDICIKHKFTNHWKLRQRKQWYFYTEDRLEAISMFKEYFDEHYDSNYFEYVIY